MANPRDIKGCRADNNVNRSLLVGTADVEGRNVLNALHSIQSDFKGSVDRYPSYTEMIAKVILSDTSTAKTLQDIYRTMEQSHPFLQQRGRSWKNSVRHTLSFNECFLKVPREDSGQRCNWTVHPRYLHRFSIGNFKSSKIFCRRSRPLKDSGKQTYDIPKPYETAASGRVGEHIRLKSNQQECVHPGADLHCEKCSFPFVPLHQQNFHRTDFLQHRTTLHHQSRLSHYPMHQSNNFGCFSTAKQDYLYNQTFNSDHNRIFSDFSKFCIDLLTNELHSHC